MFGTRTLQALAHHPRGLRPHLLPVALAVAAAWASMGSAASSAAGPQGGGDSKAPAVAALGLPPGERPVRVRARFDLHDINEIDDDAESFQFTGVMTLVWKDPRLAFDPAEAGMSERTFDGSFQFNEMEPAWYPQVVMVNESGLYAKSGVVKRVSPDGTCTLIETVNAAAKSDLNMRAYPFDRHQLRATFEVLGFGRDEVVFEADQGGGEAAAGITIPQWRIEQVRLLAEDRPAPYAGPLGVASSLALAIDVDRQSFYIMRLVVMPLAMIVALSFAVFWMDRSSLGDRISVSFIGILTGVTYQLVMSSSLPQIAYPTVMHAFLYLSFLVMCATVVINLLVGSMDKRQRFAAGDRIDQLCRWIFPVGYALILAALGAAGAFARANVAG